MKAKIEKGLTTYINSCRKAGYPVNHLCVNVNTGNVYIPHLPAETYEVFLYRDSMPIGRVPVRRKDILTAANRILDRFDNEPVPF
jgi:hypothetical protein